MVYLGRAVFIALCMVIATVNCDGYDDGTAIKNNTKAKRCDDYTCDQECRHYGFLKGKCSADDFCTCTPKQDLNIYKLLVNRTAIDNNIKAKRCDDYTCDQECRSYGFLKGKCSADDFCTCTPKLDLNIYKLLVNRTATDNNIKAKRCDDYTCDQECRSYGFLKGKCSADDFCTCTPKQNINIYKLLINTFESKRTVKDLNKCNDFVCNRDCIKLRFFSGKCVRGRCTCKMEPTEGTAMEENVKELSACKNEDCDAECRSIGCKRGQCAGDDCYCDIWKSDNEIKLIDIVYGLKDLNECKESECNQDCLNAGYVSGKCFGNTCTCKIRLSEVQALRGIIKDLNGCKESECYQDCINHGYISGTCVGNTCTCKIRLSEEAVYKIEDSEVTSNEITGCTHNECSDICQNLGHTGGKCFLNKCQCNIMLEPLFQALENDESKEKGVSYVVN